MRLTLFAKFAMVSVFAVIIISSLMTCIQCTNPNPEYRPNYQTQTPILVNDDYQVVTQPSGAQIVIVKDRSGSEIFLEYMLFQTLYSGNGLNGVYGYYDQHRYDPNWNRDQQYYQRSSKTVINNYYGSQAQVTDDRPISDQVRQIEYKKSNGFVKPTNKSTYQPSAGFKEDKSKSTGSSGFSEKWYPPNTKTSTPKAEYKASPGFRSSTKPYNPSSGFKRSSDPVYKSSSGFKSSTSTKSPGTSTKSSGFGKKQ